MKKQWLGVALIAVLGLAASSFADVQNIRLSGDIRTRGYFLSGAGSTLDPNTNLGKQEDGTTSYIEQRTRVCVEADLEDHILVVVTLAAEGLWGDISNTSQDSGPGTGNGTGASAEPDNKKWDAGVNEAYVQLNEVFYTPSTVKIGRQYLMYGNGLILSSVEQEYNYDSARLVMDFYPLTLDLVYASLVNNQSFGTISTNEGSAHLLFVNGRYEPTDSKIKGIEAYFGWVAQGSSGPISTPNNPPTLPTFNPSNSGASPWIIGGRINLNPLEGMVNSFEGVYEGGSGGEALEDNISAFILQMKGSYKFKDVAWSPVINWGGTYASGGGKGQNPNATTSTGYPQLGSGQFIPWYDYQEGLNGYLFSPYLSNIRIVNIGGTVKPAENTSFSVQGYYYQKVDRDSPAGSNPNLDFGGLSGWQSTAKDAALGLEIDSILGYDYSKDVRLQLIYAVFLPDDAFQQTGSSAAAQEVRGEISVKF